MSAAILQEHFEQYGQARAKKLLAVTQALNGEAPRPQSAQRPGDDAGAVLPGADFLRGGGASEAEQVIEVLAENWDAVAVYQLCQPQWITGMNAPAYAGIAAQEIESAACLLHMPRKNWPDLAWAMGVMSDARRALEQRS